MARLPINHFEFVAFERQVHSKKVAGGFLLHEDDRAICKVVG